jgi:hypothetical protein
VVAKKSKPVFSRAGQEERTVNIDKVNSILSKALVQIQEGEAESLRALVLSDSETDGDEPTAFEALVGDLADKLVAECKVDDKVAIEGIVEVAGAMADNGELPEIFGLDNPTEEDVDGWVKAVEQSNLVDVTIQHLTA